jgi:hypothetical protein
MRYTFPKTPTIKWEAAASAPPPVAARPKQLPYHKPELSADLSPGDWSLLSRMAALASTIQGSASLKKSPEPGGATGSR